MAVRTGGRPRQFDTDDIVRVGRELGLQELSLNAVAARLGVSSTALYRHVDGRWGLERLVGESILDELRLQDNGEADVVRHLLSFGLQLRAHVLAHPGLAGYLQTLFPRGAGGRRLLADEVAALGKRGYLPDAAMVVSGAVATTVIGFARAEDALRNAADGLDEQRRDAEAGLRSDRELRDAQAILPDVDPADYFRLVLTAAIRGLVEAAPPGRPVPEIIAGLQAAGEGV